MSPASSKERVHVPWPGHPDAPPYELTDAEIRELRANAAAERISTPAQRPDDIDLAAEDIDWDAMHTLIRLRLLGQQGDREGVTPTGRRVLEQIEWAS